MPTPRIESITKKLSIDILVSEKTRNEVCDYFNLLPMGEILIKEKSEQFNTFWIPPQAKVNRTYQPKKETTS